MSCDESHDLWNQYYIFLNSSEFIMAVDNNGYVGKSLKLYITIV